MTQKDISSHTARPLSPHLQIYRPQITTVLSITHRITGVVLVVGSILLVGWLWSAAYSATCFTNIHTFFVTPLGRMMLMGWTLAFYFHFCNGIRHLFWDVGMGFDIPRIHQTGWAAIIASLCLTILTWAFILGAV